ncbi:KpsF/GutQ family sugar-phosphate isomerase [Thalassotalea fusca]
MINEVELFSKQSTVSETFLAHSEALKLMAELSKDHSYFDAIRCLKECSGHVIVCGMGKSGHVGKKMAATFASTGTPSFFLHPSEAFHGDLGMITKSDVMILISNSGETDEVLQLIPSLQIFGNSIIAITNNENSTLARNAHIILPIVMDKEACPNNLAPTTSTMITMAIGDALAIALMKYKRFEANDFARYHPGGSLGRKLLTKVGDTMKIDNLPIVNKKATFADVVLTMNQGRLGLAVVVEDNRAIGVITDGDLRRTISKLNRDFTALYASDMMTKSPKFICNSEMIEKAENVMDKYKISSLLVKDSESNFVGVIQRYNT